MHQKLKRTSYTPQDVRLIILGSYIARQTDLSAGHMSSPQSFEAEAARQPGESASHAFSSGYSTAIEYMARTSNLRHRVPTPPPAISIEDALQLLEDRIKGSIRYQTNTEPSIGDPYGYVECCFVGTRGDRGGSRPVYYCFVCGFKSGRLHRLMGHQRSKHGHWPFACPYQGWYVHIHTFSPSPHPLWVRRPAANLPISCLL